MLSFENILIKPLLTEKTTNMSDGANVYAFKVHSKANKFQVKSAVEKLFDVKVISVRTLNLPGKNKRFGKNAIKTSPSKKAYIKVKEGQKIEFFKGI